MTGTTRSAVKERPILFTPENAQKCHDGTKTQTRRIVKPQPNPGLVYWMTHDQSTAIQNGPDYPDNEDDVVPCPYGEVGDRLWVKEAWCVGKPALPSGCGIIPYYGPSAGIDRSVCTKVVHRGAWTGGDQPKWRSGMFMPRWACRTVLELTAVRVERLQDITPADAKAEGDIERSGFPEYHERGPACHVDWYRALWDSINGAGSWDANPWVWVLEFKKIGGA